MVCGPEIDVDGIEDTEKREAPGNTVNDCLLAVGSELIDNGAEKEDVNEGPRKNQLNCCGNLRSTDQMRNAQGAGVM